jgi:hypothetical protein
VIGDSSAKGSPGAKHHARGDHCHGLVYAPIHVGGNAVSVIGDSTTGARKYTYPMPDPPATPPNCPVMPDCPQPPTYKEDRHFGALVNAPIHVSGNAVSVIGDSTAGSHKDAYPMPEPPPAPPECPGMPTQP